MCLPEGWFAALLDTGICTVVVNCIFLVALVTTAGILGSKVLGGFKTKPL